MKHDEFLALAHAAAWGGAFGVAWGLMECFLKGFLRSKNHKEKEQNENHD